MILLITGATIALISFLLLMGYTAYALLPIIEELNNYRSEAGEPKDYKINNTFITIPVPVHTLIGKKTIPRQVLESNWKNIAMEQVDESIALELSRELLKVSSKTIYDCGMDGIEVEYEVRIGVVPEEHRIKEKNYRY